MGGWRARRVPVISGGWEPREPSLDGIGAKRAGRLRGIRFIASTIAIAAAIMVATATNAEALTRVPHRCASDPRPPVVCAIHFHLHRANVLRKRMGERRLPYRWIADRRTTSDARRERILTYWLHVHARTRRRYVAWRRSIRSAMSWYHSSGAECVHGKEGGWHETSLSGAPYHYGGFQYDVPTWLRAGGGKYAPRADLATPLEQIIITKRKVEADGWGAWPNTAAACGLL